jgi:hypothetical protein
MSRKRTSDICRRTIKKSAPRRSDMMETLLVLLNERGSHGRDRRLPKSASQYPVRDSGIPRSLFLPVFIFRSAQARSSASWSPRGEREVWIAIPTIYAHWHDPITITDICVHSQSLFPEMMRSPLYTTRCLRSTTTCSHGHGQNSETAYSRDCSAKSYHIQ